jgi:photosystem II stability/assembly factor-like uncharacterized protein
LKKTPHPGLLLVLAANLIFNSCNVNNTRENLSTTTITESQFSFKGYHGPYLGSVYDMLITDKQYLYASAYENPGVFLQSRDTYLWNNLLSDMDLPNNFHKIAATSSGKIIAAGESEIYVSLDGGLNWSLSLRNGAIPFHRVHSLAISENGSVIASISKTASTSSGSGYIVSSTGTGGWKYKTPSFFIHDLQIVGNTLYAATTRGLMSSNDFGENWTQQFDLPIYSISAGGNSTLWAVSEYDVHRWDGINLTTFSSPEIGKLNSIAFHSPEAIYYSFEQLNGVFKLDPSTGISENIELGFDYPMIHFLKIHDNDLYVGTHEYGVIRKALNSPVTNPVKMGIPAVANSILLDNNQNMLISLLNKSATNQGLWKKENHSTNWEKISDFGAVIIDSSGDYFQFSGLSIFRSNDAGKTWQTSELSVPKHDQFGVESYWMSVNGNLRVVGSGGFNVDSKAILEFKNNQWVVIGEIPRIYIPFGAITETTTGVYISNQNGIFKLSQKLDSIESVRRSNSNIESFIFSDKNENLYIIDKDNVILRSMDGGKVWHTFLVPDEKVYYYPLMSDSQNRIWFRGIKANPSTGAVIDRFLLVADVNGSSFKRLRSDLWKHSADIRLAEKNDGKIYVSTTSNGLQLIESIAN